MDDKRKNFIEKEGLQGEDVFRVLAFQDVIDDISASLAEADGERIAEIHNQICSNQIEYKEDSIWQERTG
jgi:hypothetical protein